MRIGDEKVPYFFRKKLINKDHILSLANDHLKGTDIFVTGIRISSDNSINLFIDGDNGVTIANCVALSRAIESNLDRDKADFALDVSSHGATTPLVMWRQYPKHMGRNFEVKLLDGSKAEGTMTACDKDSMTLEYSVRENKPIGKGKVNVTKQQIINFNQIKESTIKLKY
jgi:ribosome maturation factor RimP